MFYPDLEENSSRGIKSGAISKYQRNVGLYPAAFTLLVNFFNQVSNLFLLVQTYHCNGNPGVTTKEERGIGMESGTEFCEKMKFCCS